MSSNTMSVMKPKRPALTPTMGVPKGAKERATPNMVPSQPHGQVTELSELHAGIPHASGSIAQGLGAAFVQEHFRARLSDHGNQRGQGTGKAFGGFDEDGYFPEHVLELPVFFLLCDLRNSGGNGVM